MAASYDNVVIYRIVRGLCANFQITRFLNREDVQHDLGVNRTWAPCTRFLELLVS